VQTSVGGELRLQRLRASLVAIVGFMIVSADLWLASNGHAYSGARWCLLSRGRLDAIGLKIRPNQGLVYWVKATLKIGALVALFATLVFVSLRLCSVDISLPLLPPSQFWPVFTETCITAPILEEFIYRFSLCIAAVMLFGPRPTIALSGAVFAALHFIYGNPGPDNFIAGFFLGWAFLKSGTILIPIILHGLGNLCVMLAQVANWSVHNYLRLQVT
jgi:membrane protease YdiL (CAAX protease family)